MMTNTQSTTGEANTTVDEQETRGDVSLDFIIEKEMLEMGLDPKKPSDIQEFWSKKGLLG